MLKIKEIREQKKITQDEIAKGTGIPKRTYITYEQGTSDIPYTKLQKIALFLNTSISEIVGEISNNSNIVDSFNIKNKGNGNNFFADNRVMDAERKVEQLQTEIIHIKKELELKDKEIELCKRENELLKRELQSK